MSQPVDAIQAALDRAREGRSFEFYRLPSETDEQRAARLDAEREPAPEVPGSEQLGAALTLESHTRGLTRFAVEQTDLPTDPDYVPPAFDSPAFKAMAEGVPEEYWPRLADARSARHAQFIKDGILDELDAAQKLADAGWSGTALRIGTSVLDPVSLSTILLTGGASVIASGSRAARAAKLAAAAGAENVALESVLLGTRETKDADDLYWALLGGIVAGGAIGAVLPASARTKLYETGKELAAGGTGPGKVATEVNIELDESLSAGAAQSSRAPTELLKEQPSAELLNTPQLKGVEAKLRFDWYGQLAKSDNPYMRDLGRRLLEDPVGQRGVAQAASAEEFATVLKKRALTSFYREANPALSSYLDGVPLGQRGEATNRFFEAVTNALRAGGADGPIGRAVEGMRKAIRTAAEEAKRFGVRGFDELELDDGYVPRIPQAQKIDQLVTRFGNKQIEGLLAAAFSRASGVAEDVARKVAKGYIHNVRMRGAGAQSDFRIAVADLDTLVASMKAAGISDEEAEAVAKTLKGFGEKDTSKAGKIARVKRRLTLDETVTAQLKDQAGELVSVAVTDLFENDARILTRMYVSSVGGHAALARAGITSPAEWETVLRNARLYAHDRLKMDPKAVDLEITKLQQVYDVLTGKPLIDYDDPVRAMSFVARDWAYVAQSGMFGFAQASELAAVLTTGGFRLVAESVPALKGMFKRAADGQLTDYSAREAEDFWAPGTDALLHSTVNRFEGAYDEELIPRAHALLDKTEGARHTLRKVAGYASGLTPITVAMQRLSSRYIAQRLVNTAFGRGRGFSADRLAAMGLDAKMQARVFDQIKTHAVMDRTGPRADLERWTDLDARDAFVLAVSRETNRTVLVPTLGGAPNVRALFRPDSEMGKVLTQFMTFAIQAHSRILMHGVKNMDAERAVNWMLGMTLAGMAYVGRTHLEGATRKDRAKFLKERLEPDKIAKAAFNMSGFSALLPGAYDTAAKVLPGIDPAFSHARTSGLGSGIGFSSFPAGAMGVGALDAASALNDGKFTQTDWKNVQRLLPLSRVLGVKQVLDAIGSDLPEK